MSGAGDRSPATGQLALADCRFLANQIAQQGPLGGLVTALAHASPIVVIACDFPAYRRSIALADLSDCSSTTARWLGG